MKPDAFKRDFLGRVADFGPFQQLADLLPDVAFFVKDRRGRFVMNNQRAAESCGVDSERKVIGRDDRDFYSRECVAIYRAQDEQVMRTGQPIINAVCPAPEKGADWMIVYSKLPIRDRRGRVIGVAGIWREVRNLRAPPPQIERIAQAVEAIHRRFGEALSVDGLAKDVGLSRRQFERLFKRLFGAAPHAYLQRVRINAGCRLLEETARKTTDIAMDVGFYDHSHFSRTFQKLMGVSPQVYRRRHAVK